MQKSFIKNLDERGKANIENKKSKIGDLSKDVDNLMLDNRTLNENITDVYQPQLQGLEVTLTKSLRRMNGVKAKTGTKDTKHNQGT